jgi:hypothetical protein
LPSNSRRAPACLCACFFPVRMSTRAGAWLSLLCARAHDQIRSSPGAPRHVRAYRQAASAYSRRLTTAGGARERARQRTVRRGGPETAGRDRACVDTILSRSIAVQCSVVQCSAVQCSTVRTNAHFGAKPTVVLDGSADHVACDDRA